MSTEGQVLVAGGSALLRKRPLVLGALAVLLALAIAASLAVTKPWASTKDRADVAAPAPGDRVLQSVDVTMQSNGALTRVGDDVVIARAQGGKADTYSTTYDPSAVVDQLPVRVLTAYRTEQGSGTDLGDLKGYTGRLTIDLTVQNLTVRSQQISYDVAGRSRTTTALVGAPLTVVASAALPGIDPATVVTAPADAPTDAATDTGSTNGVLSQAQDGTTQVQWASILAPPQLDSTATFRVVLDAKDFAVPTVDLSVQPGLVTDPSVGALIDSAFNPKNSSELALETRTIALIGDVNDVLGRASGTISGVRKTLDASSKTLGTKTVQSLTEDTKTISSSLKTSSDNIDSLGDDLKKSLETTQSATLQRMSETVSGLQDLIGDTSAAAPAVKVSGTGCAATVSAATSGQGVYASLLSVTAQLDAYATTTQGCKKELQSGISRTIGPADPDGSDAQARPYCPDTADATSVTCSLKQARAQFLTVLDQITEAQSASKALDPAALGGALSGIDTLSDQVGAVVTASATLLGRDADHPEANRQRAAQEALTTAVTVLHDARASIGVNGAPLAATKAEVDRLHKQARTNRYTTGYMVNQNADLAAKLCRVKGDGVVPGTLTSAQVELFRSYLVSQTCPDKNGKTLPLAPPRGYRYAMSTRLTDQGAAWDSVARATDTRDVKGGLGQLLAEQRTSLAGLDEQLGAVDEQLAKTSAGIKDNPDSIAKLYATAVDTQSDLAALRKSLSTTQGTYAAAKTRLDLALQLAANSASDQGAIDKAIKQVNDQRTTSSKDLDKAFAASAAGISAAADALREGTAGTLEQQQDDLTDQAKQDEADLSGRTRAGLDQVSSDVTSATRDLDSTRTSLTTDLNNVLLDLGNPKQQGKGLLGTLGKSARSADSADFQLGLASDTVSSYSAVRSQEVSGILLRQAQAEAALQRQAELPAFATEMPANTQHRTVYLFHLGGDR